jgi:hypothetical protein
MSETLHADGFEFVDLSATTGDARLDANSFAARR